MSLHNEIECESDICEYLAAHGWLYAEKDAADRKVFDSVIVVSDRNVIDGQLSEAIEAMQRNQGVVATIKGKSGSKSSELAEALSSDKKILVCTIQTFPYALEAVSDLAATKGY